MNALLGISLWITLVTVFPGFVTIALLVLSAYVLRPELISAGALDAVPGSGTVLLSVFVTIMILTQFVGILLESLLTRTCLLGRTESKTAVVFLAPRGATTLTEKVDRRKEYGYRYQLLALFGENDDAHGHLKRVLAQFFMTNNVMAAILIAFVFSAALCGFDGALTWRPAGFYLLSLFAFFVLALLTAGIRFRTMAISLRSARLKLALRTAQ